MTLITTTEGPDFLEKQVELYCKNRGRDIKTLKSDIWLVMTKTGKQYNIVIIQDHDKEELPKVGKMLRKVSQLLQQEIVSFRMMVMEMQQEEMKNN